MSSKIDISGKIFYSWTVSSKTRRRGIKLEWLCICSCGRRTWMPSDQLRNGRSKSCRNCSHRKPDICVGLKKVFGSYKTHAKARGLPFLLTLENFKTICIKPCYYCGKNPNNIVIVRRQKDERTIKYSEIDRKNNSLGYTLRNSVPCCFMCNRAKDTATKKEFLDHCKRIVFHSKLLP